MSHSESPDDAGSRGTLVAVDRTEYARGYRSAWHHHQKAQLIYPSRGVMTIHTSARSWVVPPLRACWLPALQSHLVESSGRLEMHSVYCEEAAAQGQPDQSGIVQVSALLRELIFAMREAGAAAPADASTERLGLVLMDQMNLGRGPRPWSPPALAGLLADIGRTLVTNPADPRPLHEWSREVGRATKTLSREFLRQTGMTFTDYRQQIRLHAALHRLSSGASVTAVAYDLGFSSASNFVAAFRKATGTTPGRYLKSRSRNQRK